MNLYTLFLFTIPAIVSPFLLTHTGIRKTCLKDVKQYDPDFYHTFDIFDKFEYYSILGDKEKQAEYMRKISLYLQIMKNIN
jgi:hypothetical protein